MALSTESSAAAVSAQATRRQTEDHLRSTAQALRTKHPTSKPPGEKLTDTGASCDMDSSGRLLLPAELRARIALTGVAPGARATVYPILTGAAPWNSTQEERQHLKEIKSYIASLK